MVMPWSSTPACVLGHAAPKVHSEDDDYGYAADGDAEGQGQCNRKEQDGHTNDFLGIVPSKADQRNGGTSAHVLLLGTVCRHELKCVHTTPCGE